MPRRIIALVDDMLFVAKIRSTAEAIGVQVQFPRTIDTFWQKAIEEPTSLIIVDLQVQSCDPFDMASKLKSDELLKSIPLLGFFSHVQTSLITKAEEAGYDRVLPRSSFSKNLASILEGTF